MKSKCKVHNADTAQPSAIISDNNNEFRPNNNEFRSNNNEFRSNNDEL